ncbi:hypothetical protein K8I28_10035 [bacterium]|nr:hypothetical protein [bacterium]
MATKRSNHSLLLIFTVLVLLTALISIWDALRIRRLTFELAEQHAQSLAATIRHTIEASERSERAIRYAITDQLYSVAYLSKRLWTENVLRPEYLEALAIEGGVARITLLDRTCRVLSTNRPITITNVIKQLLTDTLLVENFSGEMTVGFHETSDSGEMSYSVAVSRANGGAVLVSIGADELVSFRRELGTGALLRSLSEQHDIAYAVLVGESGTLAATPDLPEWIGSKRDPFIGANSTPGGQFHKTPDGTLFNLRIPYDLHAGVDLRLGLRTDELSNIRKRSLIAIGIRSLLFVGLAVAILGYLLSRQNVRYLAEERQKILADITRLEADRAMKERLVAMGALAGGVAHEIRNPLNTVNMVTQRLKHEFDVKEDSAEYNSLLESMSSEIERIGRIIKDFLQFARPPKANKQVNDLKTVIDELGQSFSTQCSGTGKSFEMEGSILRPFLFDVDQIKQAVLNLLQNSLRALENIPNGNITLKYYSEANWVVIEVIDNGPGIANEDRGKVFDLYYTTHPEGTGIGLPLVHRIAVEHGGSVSLADNPEGGTIVRLELGMQ